MARSTRYALSCSFIVRSSLLGSSILLSNLFSNILTLMLFP
jgi:hypothetical protein